MKSILAVLLALVLVGCASPPEQHVKIVTLARVRGSLSPDREVVLSAYITQVNDETPIFRTYFDWIGKGYPRRQMLSRTCPVSWPTVILVREDLVVVIDLNEGSLLVTWDLLEEPEEDRVS